MPWTYLRPSHRDEYNNVYGWYRCACGVEKAVRVAEVKNGKSKSCGCWRVQKSRERMSGVDGDKARANSRATWLKKLEQPKSRWVEALDAEQEAWAAWVQQQKEQRMRMMG